MLFVVSAAICGVLIAVKSDTNIFTATCAANYGINIYTKVDNSAVIAVLAAMNGGPAFHC